MIKRSAYCVLISAEAALCAALACDPNVVIGRYPPAESTGGGAVPDSGVPDANVTAGTGGSSAGSGGSTTLPEAGGVDGEGGSAGAPPQNTLLWSANHEAADMSEWEEEGGYYSTGQTPVPSDARAHGGQYSLAFTIDTSDGDDKVLRVYRSTVPEPAYYSAWFFFEEDHVQDPWWSMFVFVQATDLTDPGAINSVWDLNLRHHDDDGLLYPYVYDHLTGDNSDEGPLPVPVGEWVHLEFYFNFAPSDTQLHLYLNGELSIELNGLGEPDDPELGWSVGNGAGSLIPPLSTIYIDDAAISTVRLGPL